MNNIYFLLVSIEEKSGGLFDFDGTLPLIAIQFLVLMFILDKLLYTPILDKIFERKTALKNQEEQTEIKIKKTNIAAEKYNNFLAVNQAKVQSVLKDFEMNLDLKLEDKLKKFDQSRATTITKTEQSIEKTFSTDNTEIIGQYKKLLATIIVENVIPTNNISLTK